MYGIKTINTYNEFKKTMEIISKFKPVIKEFEELYGKLKGLEKRYEKFNKVIENICKMLQPFKIHYTFAPLIIKREIEELNEQVDQYNKETLTLYLGIVKNLEKILEQNKKSACTKQ